MTVTLFLAFDGGCSMNARMGKKALFMDDEEEWRSMVNTSLGSQKGSMEKLLLNVDACIK